MSEVLSSGQRMRGSTIDVHRRRPMTFQPCSGDVSATLARVAATSRTFKVACGARPAADRPLRSVSRRREWSEAI